MGKHERMSAERAYELGLVTEVVPHEDLLTRAKEIAEIVNSNAPLPFAVPGWPSTRRSGCRCTRRNCSPNRSANASPAPRTRSKAARVRGETRTELAGTMTTTFETILYEVDADAHVATITLNRPDALNTFNRLMRHEMRDVWALIKADDQVHAVVLRAAGDRAFGRARCAFVVRAARDRVESRDPGDCSARSGRRCGSRLWLRCKACVPPAHCISSTRPTW